MWWAIETVTAVGYGDVPPHTVGGRIIASVLMLVGIAFLAILTATIASAFVADDAKDDAEEDAKDQADLAAALERIEQRLERVEAALGRLA